MSIEAAVAGREYGIYMVWARYPDQPGRRNITVIRGVPTVTQSLTYADPFGDSTAVIWFPGINHFADTSSNWFLREYVDYDIEWVPAVKTATAPSGKDIQLINPESNKLDMWTDYANKVKVWEGYAVSLSMSDQGSTLQLQGALYVADRYLMKPSFPLRPVAMEHMLAKVFDPTKRNLSGVKPMRINWPDGWALKYERNEALYYEPTGVQKGENWTGYSTRNTGQWDNSLTGYAQDILSQMYTNEESGVNPDDQWTIRKYTNRRPVLEVRELNRPFDFTVKLGTPGVEVSLSRDSSASINVIYAKGSDLEGNAWSNAVIEADSSETTYEPLAWDERLYPYEENIGRHTLPRENYIQFSSGIPMGDAEKAARVLFNRQRDPGYNGSITLRVSPEGMPLWKIRAGMSMNLKNYAGLDKLRLHIAEVQNNVSDGSVTLTVDTAYRDLLTLEEVRARTRDPMTPSKLIRLNRRTQMIEDQVKPWDFQAGSGCIPKESRRLHAARRENFPWTNILKEKGFRPKDQPEYYIEIDASNPVSEDRWTKRNGQIGPVQIVMSQAGTAHMTQIVVVDINGNIVPAPFHVSIYKNKSISIPHSGQNFSAFAPNHWQSYDTNGLPFPSGENVYRPDDAIVVGWGNYDERCGYSPNRYSDGASPTGLFIDESVWTWNMAESNANFDPSNARAGKDMTSTETWSLWLMAYAEYTETVYMIGQIFRLNPGSQ